jgi:hypothetical protein
MYVGGSAGAILGPGQRLTVLSMAPMTSSITVVALSKRQRHSLPTTNSCPDLARKKKRVTQGNGNGTLAWLTPSPPLHYLIVPSVPACHGKSLEQKVYHIQPLSCLTPGPLSPFHSISRPIPNNNTQLLCDTHPLGYQTTNSFSLFYQSPTYVVTKRHV